MSKFICIENDAIVSILDYIPNTPDTVEIYEISDDDHDKIVAGYSYFDVKSRKVLDILGDDLKQLVIRDNNIKNQLYLNDTDWIILRHLREKALDLQTSLTESAFIEIEKTRQKAAKAIV